MTIDLPRDAATTRAAVRRLAERTAAVEWATLDDATRDRAQLVLLDLIGVTLAGSRTAERRAYLAATPTPPGEATVLGEGVRTAADVAVVANGASACCLELDEGSRRARGHPAAHAAFAALAEAERTGASGADLLSAVVAGYEAGARLGEAATLRNGVHPHGTWGAVGAGVAAGRLAGLGADDLCGVIDVASGLSLAPPFAVALDGLPLRDLWVGMSGLAGLHAVRMAVAGLAPAGDTLLHTFGSVLGTLEPSLLDADARETWAITQGYFKQHAACAYTHPPADAILDLRRSDATLADPATIEAVEIATHHLATPLARTDVPTRLAAMFSIPWVVAVTLVHGEVTPRHMAADARRDGVLRGLAARVTVVLDHELDRALPAQRGARVTIRRTDGRTLTHCVDLPIGDADHHPLGRAEIQAKLTTLLGTADAARVVWVVDQLPAADDIRPLLARLPNNDDRTDTM